MNIDYYSNQRDEVVTHLEGGFKKLLDIGCGKGGVSSAIRKINPNINITGFDMYRDAVLDYDKIFDEFLECNLSKGLPEHEYSNFDLVLLLDVLEHIENPDELLINLVSQLKQGAQVVISLPNFINYSNIFNILRTRRFKYEQSGILDKTHLRFFTRIDAEILIKQAGLRINKQHFHVTNNSLKSKFIKLVFGYDFVAYQNIFYCYK